MKKNVLTLSITAALVGLGFAGGAHAIGLGNNTGTDPITGATGTKLLASVDGIGQMLVVPYYTVQGGNTTMINLVNTDTVNGKAVKVRFRGAANSDDVFDFQVFLSPADVWSASVSQDSAGQARLTVSTSAANPETSCTKPSKAALNATPFSTVRVDPNRSAAGQLNETREGYVEMFNMADIRPFMANGTTANALYTAIKHKSTDGNRPLVAPCTAAALNLLDADPVNVAAANTLGLFAPTSGLMSNWIILNGIDAGAWSGQATALNAVDGSGVIVAGALTYFPQTDQKLLDLIVASRVATFTADPVLIANPSMMRVYDLPDFSIPYTASALPADQVTRLGDAIATNNIINEFLTYSAINATTDWVLSMPTRRYSAAYDYKADEAVYNTGSRFFNSTNVIVLDRQLCLKNASSTSYDQEEYTAVDLSTVIISPQPIAGGKSFYICGEVSVMSFNNGEKAGAAGLITTASGSLKATVARSAIDNSYNAGWSNVVTPGLGFGTPVLGYQAIRALGNATGQAFGATLDHRTTRTNVR